MTAEFRRRLDKGATLDDLLPEAFAVCREAGRRVLGMRHFDVQLMGGMVLHRGGIAEMKTGEGKTLVATLPVYLNALAARASTSSRSTTTWPAATPSGWAASTSSSACRWASSSTASRTASARPSYRSRHRLRHKQRVRLRLPARQHEGFDRALRPARPQLRHRRRGRLDPHRRGAHAAHHLGPGGAVGRPVPEGQRHHPGPAQGHRLHRRREGALGDPDRQRHRADRAAARGRQPLQPREHRSGCTTSRRP